MCEGSVKSESGRRSDREGSSKHMGTILNLSKRQMYLLKVNSYYFLFCENSSLGQRLSYRAQWDARGMIMKLLETSRASFKGILFHQVSNFLSRLRGKGSAGKFTAAEQQFLLSRF